MSADSVCVFKSHLKIHFYRSAFLHCYLPFIPFIVFILSSPLTALSLNIYHNITVVFFYIVSFMVFHKLTIFFIFFLKAPLTSCLKSAVEIKLTFLLLPLYGNSKIQQIVLKLNIFSTYNFNSVAKHHCVHESCCQIIKPRTGQCAFRFLSHCNSYCLAANSYVYDSQNQ